MKSLLCLLSAIALTFSASAADKATVPDAKLSDYTIGALITGPAVDLSNVGGKAVVIEAWGIHCGPCLASLPSMQKLARTNKADTIFIGAHSQSGTDAEVTEVVKKNKLTYSIVKGVRGPGGSNGIPHAYVFDTSGKLIFVGSPFDRDFESAVRKAGRPAKAAN